jgi:hypothetical protein
MQIRNVAHNCISSHRVLHRHTLVVKNISLTLKNVLDEAVQTVNYIKIRPLESRLFKIMCEDMGSQHTDLFLHTKVWWISQKKKCLLDYMNCVKSSPHSFWITNSICLIV